MTYREDFRTVEREGCWLVPRVLLVILVFLVVSYGIGFLATGGDLVIYRFWAPKYANAQREVFVNTNSYVQGKTDNGIKKSACGLIRVEKENDHFVLYDHQTMEQEQGGELKTVFLNGKMVRNETLAEIRERLRNE
jgi:hypothetical protein